MKHACAQAMSVDTKRREHDLSMQPDSGCSCPQEPGL